MQKPSIPLVAIVGPTAVGKTSLAIRLAISLGGEIVSADSRQVYRHMDIGTAKPSAAEQAMVRHHMIDVVDPDESFTVSDYKRLAAEAISRIHDRGRLPLLVGGTGLYVRAVADGLSLPRVPPNEPLRAALERRLDSEGATALASEYARLDPRGALTIDWRNPRRLIRALEVCYETGQPFSELRQCEDTPYTTVRVGLCLDRELLYQRIDKRVDAIVQAGLVQEVRGLLDRGYSSELPSMSGLGYRQIVAYLDGRVTLEQAVQRLKYDTHHYARRQITWFRRDGKVRWFNMAESGTAEGVARYVAAELAEPSSKEPD